MDVLDVSDRLSKVSRAVAGLSSLLYGSAPVPANGGELDSLLMILHREISVIGRGIEKLSCRRMD